MNQLFLTIVALVCSGFWAYRSICILAYARRVKQERYQGLRLVIRNERTARL